MINTNNNGRVMMAVSHLSYRMFAKRYGIRLMKKNRGKYVYRTSMELKPDIYNYEKRNRPSRGMYF